jgi:hypothetical protein
MGRSRSQKKPTTRGKPGHLIKDVTAEVENRLLNAAEVATATTSAEVNLAAAIADAVIEPGSGGGASQSRKKGTKISRRVAASRRRPRPPEG